MTVNKSVTNQHTNIYLGIYCNNVHVITVSQSTTTAKNGDNLRSFIILEYKCYASASKTGVSSRL